MKKFKTTNGNFILNIGGTEVVYLTAKGELKMNMGSFTTAEAERQGLREMNIFIGEVAMVYEFLAKKTEKELQQLKSQSKELIMYKDHFGQLPEWKKEEFTSREQYDRFKFKELVKELQKTFKLKTQKAVKEQVVKIYTVKYIGKNGGYKYFNRTLDWNYDLRKNIGTYGLKKNLAVVDLFGNIVEVRGNIEKRELI